MLSIRKNLYRLRLNFSYPFGKIFSEGVFYVIHSEKSISYKDISWLSIRKKRSCLLSKRKNLPENGSFCYPFGKILLSKRKNFVIQTEKSIV